MNDNVKSFYEKLAGDKELSGKYLELTIKFANENGFALTAEDFTAGGELSDDDLTGVSGGYTVGNDVAFWSGPPREWIDATRDFTKF